MWESTKDCVSNPVSCIKGEPYRGTPQDKQQVDILLGDKEQLLENKADEYLTNVGEVFDALPGVGKVAKETGKGVVKETVDVVGGSVGAARVKAVWDEKAGKWRDPVTGQFAKAPLFDLSKVDPPTGKSYEGMAYRYERSDRVDTTWDKHEGNVNASHRYTDKGSGGVYGGDSPETAFEEVKYYGVEEGRVLVSKDVKLKNILDLTDIKVRQRLGVNLKDISSDSYNSTHQLGNWAKENGYDGILAPSARNNGKANIVILKND